MKSASHLARLTRGLRRSMLVGAALPCFALPALAADSTGNYAVRGVGTMNCAQFVNAVDGNTPELRAFVSWMEGALTAINRLTPNTFDVVPFNSPGAVAAIVLRQCRERPTMGFDAAVRATVDTLGRARVTTNSPWVEMTVGQNRVTLRAETIAALQARLQSLGLMTTPPDGRFSMATREAIKRFQQVRRLPVTELPDPDTVFLLLVNP